MGNVDTKHTLAPRQVKQYERDGFLFPIPVLSAEEVLQYRAALEELEAQLGNKLKPVQVVQPHLHFRWAYDLATHPAVLDVVEAIIGPNILVHTTSIFCKYPYDPAYISWHQDGYYWRLSAPRLVSAWIALSDSHPENGCMRVLPGTHRQRLAHCEHRHDANLLTSGLTVAGDIDQTAAVDLVLRAGEMSLHHVQIVHGSEANRSASKRIGFAIRYVAPDVSQALEHHVVVLARGRDAHHHYELLDKAPAGSIAEGIAAQAAFARRRDEKHRYHGETS
jgi:ectoine hydroxylase-related dioxygenase (phytanoyl-CoA dioxygenase family)